MRGVGRWVAVIAIASILTLSSPAAAQDGKPDATLRLSQTSVAFILGYTWGSGSLTFQDKIYRVEVGAFSVLSLGVVKAEATGEVFHLKRVEDFDGTYTAVSVEGTLAGGAGATIMQNQNGVVIQLFTTTEGLNLKLAPEGVRLSIQ
jgi:hypothetical protein